MPHIIVADNDPHIRELISVYLRSEGFLLVLLGVGSFIFVVSVRFLV